MKLIKQMAKFASVGAIATLVHALVYASLGALPSVSPWMANLLAFMVAFIFSFVGHFLWTFRDSTGDQPIHQSARYSLRFLTVALIGLLLNAFSVWLVVDIWELNYLMALVPMVFVVPVMTFGLSKLWAFR